MGSVEAEKSCSSDFTRVFQLELADNVHILNRKAAFETGHNLVGMVGILEYP